jgi:hypothetical protein
MSPSMDDSSFIVVGDVFDTDDEDDDDDDVDDADADELLSEREQENATGTLILPSSSTRVTFTPPSSVDSDIASLDLIRQQRLLVSDEDDDDMEGIDDPLGLHVAIEGGPPPNVDAHHGDVRPPSKFIPEQSPTTATATGTPWTKGIEQARALFQAARMPVIMVSSPHHRRSVLLLFVYLPVLVAVLGVATYTKHLDTLRLRDLEMAGHLREQEHQERIQQLQEEIEKLKKQQSGFTFTIPEPTWLKTRTKVVDVSASATTQTLLKQWKDIKTSAYKTVDSLRTTLEKDLEEAKEWWTEKQRMVIEKLEAVDPQQHATRGTSLHAHEEEESSAPPGNNNGDDCDGDEQAEQDEAETATDTAEHTKKGKNLMPSKKTILASAAIVTVASVLLGAAIDAMFGQYGPSRLDYETFDQTFGVPLADFVD